jgi:hypothetical protein
MLGRDLILLITLSSKEKIGGGGGIRIKKLAPLVNLKTLYKGGFH